MMDETYAVLDAAIDKLRASYKAGKSSRKLHRQVEGDLEDFISDRIDGDSEDVDVKINGRTEAWVWIVATFVHDNRRVSLSVSTHLA